MKRPENKIYRIAIISSAEIDDNIAINDSFVEDLNKGFDGKIQIEWHNYHDVQINLEKNKIDSFFVSTNEQLTSFDAIYFKSYFRYHEQAATIAESLEHNNIRFIGSELRHYIPAYKLTQMARLSRGGFDIPKTVYLPMEHYFNKFDYLVASLGLPFIFKAIDGATGRDNYLVKDKDSFKNIVSENNGSNFIAQKFIPNDSDLRLVVIESQVRLIIERKRADDSTHLNNTSQGADALLLDMNTFPEKIKILSVEAAKVMNRDIAGVDVMLEKGSGKPYILEVNASPQIASGSFMEEKRQMYLDFFENLVNTKNPKNTVIGPVENVELESVSDSSIEARIDTGARTSAIWSSKAKEVDGRLNVIFFGPESSHYDGKVHIFSDYDKMMVKPSTGEEQERYVIKMPVKIGGRIVRAKFTLANRSAQTYPILIGRNVLRGKFVVDVKKKRD